MGSAHYIKIMKVILPRIFSHFSATSDLLQIILNKMCENCEELGHMVADFQVHALTEALQCE